MLKKKKHKKQLGNNLNIYIIILVMCQGTSNNLTNNFIQDDGSHVYLQHQIVKLLHPKGWRMKTK